MQVPLVADFTREVAEAYGVLLAKDHAEACAPARATFIIDGNGIGKLGL